MKYTDTMKKGDPIIFRGGCYAGMTGWLDPSAKKTTSRIGVIVDIDKNGTIKTTKVAKSSIRRANNKPSNYAEACFYEHHDIDMLMTKLCAKLAECRVVNNDIDELKYIFSKKMGDAIYAQDKKGSKARFRDVLFGRKTKKHARTASSSSSKSSDKSAQKSAPMTTD